MRDLSKRSFWVFALGLLFACQSRPPTAAVPQATVATQASPAAEPPYAFREPPPRGVTPEAAFPRIEHRSLENGLAVRSVAQGRFPIVELRLVVQAGTAWDGGKAGLPTLASQLLKAGGAGRLSSRELLERVEGMGSDLEVSTGRDQTVISLAVTKNDLEEALELLATVATAPKFDRGEFQKLKAREIERVKSNAKASGSWAAGMVLYRELFDIATGHHAYARFDATESDLEPLTLDDCRRWYATHFTPHNSVLVAVGDVQAEELEGLAKRAFRGWKGKRPVPPNFTAPNLKPEVEVWVVNRPKAQQSEIRVATLGPERASEEWASMALSDQILGGGVSGRLFLDVRERRSLAYSTYSSLVEVARGPVPMVLAAGTQTAKTPEAVAALLEHFERMGETQPTVEEIETASQYLSDSFLMQLETLGTVADLTAHLAVLGLPDDYYDTYRKQVRNLDSKQVATAAHRYFTPGRAVVVVAGDAERIAKPLSRFGKVNVVDPEGNFKTQVVVPHDPNVTLDVPG